VSKATLASVLALVPLAAWCGEAACPIVPTPKVYRATGRTARLLRGAAIVVGAKATEPERYAAERLQGLIARRFGRKLPVAVETQIGEGARQVLLLGQRATNAWLDRLCKARGIELGPTAPGHDGFVVEAMKDDGRDVVVIGGSNARGAIYGQDAFFDLLRREGDAVVFPVASIRDWPSIAWRGRPFWRLRLYLVEGAMDALARSRLNFIDLRDAPGGIAKFGYPPDFKIDLPVARRVLAEGHRRGMFVYGTVSCGVGPEKFDAVIAKFEELIALGVDGIWISFDDPGPGKEAPVLIRRVLELGRRRGFTGRLVANTQPAGSYNKIDTEFNRATVAIPGYESVKWFFTRVPCAADLAATRKLGLKSLPAWWHNMVGGVAGGFLHNGAICITMRADEKPAYLHMLPLSNGWGRPDYEKIRDAAKHTDTVMVWGFWDGWPEEYIFGALGIWAWEPARHDWARTRQGVYRYVYGPSLVDAARDFDDGFVALKSLFHLPVRRYKPNKGWPCRLKSVADRPKALARLDELDALRARLAAKAPGETAILPSRLEAIYLEPMKATLAAARAMATLDYPEYSLADIEARMLALNECGDPAAAERELAAIRGSVKQKIARVADQLRGLKGIDEYVAFWQQRVSGMRHWKTLAAQRRKEMAARHRKLVASGFAAARVKGKLTADEAGALFAPLGQAPAGRVVAELDAKDWLAAPPRAKGTWAVGPFEWQGRRLAVVSFPRHTRSQAGDFAEVRAEMAVPQVAGRLVLDAFVNDTKVDTQWTKYRFLQLWVNERLAWEEDASASRAGREWVSVDVTAQAKAGKPLALRFRLVDKRPVGCYGTVAFLGPVRLRAAAGAPGR